MKKTYTQSVAINSISAYTIGLGDRHCYNILLDAHTGEIVNVDLNLLFDQSKLLRTPEKVPFRMTRNIVSGLIGSISKSEVVSGLGWEVQGLKETMGWVFHLYKKEKTQILSQAKMLKYDPLHWWTICQEKLKIYEIKDKISLFTDADRIMARMKDKLGGFEDGFHLENDSHVCYLLKKATDVNDLIQMFPGWQPWV
jgi:ataxia telangiectasia mutated family protein